MFACVRERKEGREREGEGERETDPQRACLNDDSATNNNLKSIYWVFTMY